MWNLFWPRKLNPNPTSLTWLGRISHWLAIMIAIVGPVVAFFQIPEFEVSASIARNGLSNVVSAIVAMGLVFMAAVYFVGRILRYILSAE